MARAALTVAGALGLLVLTWTGAAKIDEARRGVASTAQGRGEYQSTR